MASDCSLNASGIIEGCPRSISMLLIWMVIVLGAVAVLLYFASINLIKYGKHPKSIGIDIDYAERLKFPAITICNQNRYRLTPMYRMGMYDSFVHLYDREILSMATDDLFRYRTDVCLSDSEFKSVLSESYFKLTYKEVTSVACEQLCAIVHSEYCSGFLYYRPSRSCLLTSLFEKKIISLATDPPEGVVCDVKYVYEYNQRLRYVEMSDFYCDMETWSTCPFTVTESSVDTLKVVTRFDHSIGKGGHVLPIQGGETPSIKIAFQMYSDMCLEIFYLLHNQDNIKLVVQAEFENLTLVPLKDLAEQEKDTHGWRRFLASVPDGVSRLRVKTSSVELTQTPPLFVDDVRVMGCEKFNRDCKRFQSGLEYMGTLAVPRGGGKCASPCRLKGDAEPTCQVYDQYNELIHVACDIPFCACGASQFACRSSGRCIPDVYRCDGLEHCEDRSDETDTCGAARRVTCDFEKPYLCGYLNADLYPGTWATATGREASSVTRYYPQRDHLGRKLTRFLYAESFIAGRGDRFLITSPPLHVSPATTDCLSFYLYTVDEEWDPALGFKIYAQSADGNLYSRLLFSLSGDNSYEWIQYNVALPSGDYVLGFEASIGYRYETTVALDDVKVGPTECAVNNSSQNDIKPFEVPSGSGTCDFDEEKLCDFSMRSTSAHGGWCSVPREFILQEIKVADEGDWRAHYATEGRISSPNYPFNPDWAEDTAEIIGPPGSKISLDLFYFSLGSCDDAHLKITDVTNNKVLFEKLCEDHTGEKLHLDTNHLKLDLTATTGEIGDSFTLTYTISHKDNIDYAMMSTIEELESPSPLGSTLISPLVSTNATRCLSFKLLALTQFRLWVADPSGSITNLLQTFRSLGEKWHPMWILLPIGQFNIHFEASDIKLAKTCASGAEDPANEEEDETTNTTRKEGDENCQFEYKKVYGFLAGLDDVAVTEGECYNQTSVDLTRCDIGDDDQCGLRDVSTTLYRWVRTLVQNRPVLQCDMQEGDHVTSLQGSCLLRVPTLHGRCLHFKALASNDNMELNIEEFMNASKISRIASIYTTFQDYQIFIREEIAELIMTVNVVNISKYAYVVIENVKFEKGPCTAQTSTWTPTPTVVLGGDDEARNDTFQNYDNEIFLQGHVGGINTTSRKPISDTVSMNHFLLETAHSKEDFIYKCEWQGKLCNENDFLSEFTDNGVCFTFNGKRNDTPHFTRRTGSRNGLQLVLNIEQYEHVLQAGTGVGVKLHIHDQSEIPLMRDTGLAIPTQMHTLIALRYEKLTRLGHPYGKCATKPLPLYEGQQYTWSRCQQQCLTLHLVEKCQCKAGFMPGDYRLCSVTEYVQCIQPEEEQFQTSLCKCPSDCEVTSFPTTMSLASLSRQTVTNLLTHTANIEKHYSDSIDVRGRADPRLIVRSIKIITDIRNAIFQLSQFSYSNFGNPHISVNVPIEVALEEIWRKVNDDVEFVFSDLDAYIDTYNRVYHRRSTVLLYDIEAVLNTMMGFIMQLYADDTSWHYDFLSLVDQVNYPTEEKVKNTELLIPEDLLNLDIGILASSENETLSNSNGTENDNSKDGPSKKLEFVQSQLVMSTSKLVLAAKQIYGDVNILKDIQTRKQKMNYIPTSLNIGTDKDSKCGTYLRNIERLAPIIDSLTQTLLRNKTNLLQIDYFLQAYHTLEVHKHAIDDCQEEYPNLLMKIQSWKTGLLEETFQKYFQDVIFDYELDSKRLMSLEAVIEGIALDIQSNLTWKRQVETRFIDNESFDPKIMTDFYYAVDVNFTDVIKSNIDRLKTRTLTIYNALIQHAAALESYFINKELKVSPLGKRVGGISLWKGPFINFDESTFLHYHYMENKLWPTDIGLNNIYTRGLSEQLVEYTVSSMFEKITFKLEQVNNNLRELRDHVENKMKTVESEMTKFNDESKISSEVILQNFLKLDIYYGELKEELITQSASYLIPDFLSDMGGYMGLLLGASVMTLWEFIDFLCHNIIRKCTVKVKSGSRSRRSTLVVPFKAEDGKYP